MNAAPGNSTERIEPRLARADDASFWPWFTWTDFARWPEKSATVVVVPITGMADWGLGHPLDLEETLSLSILEAAARRSGASQDGRRLLTLPPLRFVAGHDAGCAFAMEPDSAHRFIDEVCASIAASGFTRVVLYNASPWNEELVDVAARDIRIARGLQMFCVHLSALGFDLHPTRSRTRRTAQTLGTCLLGKEPERLAIGPPAPAETPDHFHRPESEQVSPLAEAPASLPEANIAGPVLLAAAAAKLAALFQEIAARPTLAHDGVIKPVSP